MIHVVMAVSVTLAVVLVAVSLFPKKVAVAGVVLLFVASLVGELIFVGAFHVDRASCVMQTKNVMVVGEIVAYDLVGMVTDAVMVVIDYAGVVGLACSFGRGVNDNNAGTIYLHVEIHGSGLMLSCYFVVGGHVCLVFRVYVVVQSHVVTGRNTSIAFQE